MKKGNRFVPDVPARCAWVNVCAELDVLPAELVQMVGSYICYCTWPKTLDDIDRETSWYDTHSIKRRMAAFFKIGDKVSWRYDWKDKTCQHGIVSVIGEFWVGTAPSVACPPSLVHLTTYDPKRESEFFHVSDRVFCQYAEKNDEYFCGRVLHVEPDVISIRLDGGMCVDVRPRNVRLLKA